MDDIEIARAAQLLPISQVADTLGLDPNAIEPYGRSVAKIDLDEAPEPGTPSTRAKYIVVSAITPTPLGEGKTTTVVGLTDALHGLGQYDRAVPIYESLLRHDALAPPYASGLADRSTNESRDVSTWRRTAVSARSRSRATRASKISRCSTSVPGRPPNRLATRSERMWTLSWVYQVIALALGQSRRYER